MHDIDQILTVPFRYTVHFTHNLLAGNNPLLQKVMQNGNLDPAKVIFVVDRGVCAGRKNFIQKIVEYCSQYPQALNLTCPPILAPGGERVKNTDAYVTKIHKAIYRYGLCRHSYLVAIGGGAVLDMAGYAAATAHRGIRLVRVPTTVLSQNDSGVGVKNSINAFGNKNFLGTFVPPYAVLNDVTFLETLTERDWRAGMSEAVKVAALRDPKFFRWIERHATDLAARNAKAMEHLIRRCAELHMQHIATSNDPFETGSSRPLDFGHWSAHKLELLTSFRLRHGETVAIGLALDSTYAHLTGLLPERDWRRMIDLLANLGFKLRVPKRFQLLRGRDNPQSLEHGLTQFREHLGGELTIMMLQKIGVGVEIHSVDDRILKESIETLNRVCPI
jgi:3-dehydroquinate synthase